MGSRNMKDIWTWISELFGCLLLFGTFYICYILMWAIYPEGF